MPFHWAYIKAESFRVDDHLLSFSMFGSLVEFRQVTVRLPLRSQQAQIDCDILMSLTLLFISKMQ